MALTKKPLQIAGKMQHLDLQWGEARGRARFIVIIGLESPPCLIGMDIMRPLRVRIDVTNGTVTPAQPDLQTINLMLPSSKKPPHRRMSLHSCKPLINRKPLRRTPLLTPLAALCCFRLRIFLQRPYNLSTAITLGPQRTCTFVLKTLC